MPFVVITKPAVGDPTRKDTFADPVIDDLNALQAGQQLAQGAGILNGSFELDTAGVVDTQPIEWTMALAAGNHTLVENTAANVRHGANSFKMTTPGAVSGGVVLTTPDFYAIAEAQSLILSWYMKSTVANIFNLVQVIYYDEAQSLLSTVNLYSNNSSNSTSWVQVKAYQVAPANARFFKLKFTGVNNTNAGSVWFDGIGYQIQLFPGTPFTSSSTTITGIVPQNARMAIVHLRGAGGGGGALTGGGAGGNTSFAVAAGTFGAAGGNGGGDFTSGNGGGPIGASFLASGAAEYYESFGALSGNNRSGTAGGNGAPELFSRQGGGAGGPSGHTNGSNGFVETAGGGGGGDNSGNSGGGGGAGGYVMYWVPVIGGETYTLTIGVGGTGGSGNGSIGTGGSGGNGIGAAIFI